MMSDDVVTYLITGFFLAAFLVLRYWISTKGGGEDGS
jgi:hypothetical protein